jgi:hypothetical protein
MKLIYEKWVKRRHLQKRKWEYQPHIRTFFWDRGTTDRMLNRLLEDDDEFVEWCWQHDCNVHHTWVECPDDETVTMFVLRWS